LWIINAAKKRKHFGNLNTLEIPITIGISRWERVRNNVIRRDTVHNKQYWKE